MSGVRREKALRIAVFLLLVVVLCILSGTLLSQIPVTRDTMRLLAIAATLLSVLVSYSGAFKPGWLYRSLVDSSKGGS